MNSKEESVGDSFKEPPGEDNNSGFEMMQHLINEMDKSSQRIDEFNTEQFGTAARRSPHDKNHIDLLYDEAWKSEDSDAASLKEIPADFFDKVNGDSGCEDAVTSAIAEVSKDFLAGLRASTTRNQNGDSDDSHISSDNDFKLIKGMPAYARYPETAAGLSDNDWNPYGTESDTNLSPRISSQETPSSRPLSSKQSAMLSFNPPLHSTDLDAVTPSFAIGSIPNTCARKAGVHDFSENDKMVSLKSDITADFSSISHISEQTFGWQKVPFEPVGQSDLNKTMRGKELEVHEKNNKGVTIPNLQGDKALDLLSSHQGPKSSLEYTTPVGSHISVMDRAKMRGVPKEIIDGKYPPDDSENGKCTKDVKICSHRMQGSERGDTSDEDILGQKVKQVLHDTKYLERGQGVKKTMNEVAIDYRGLQRDLQEIQESLNNNFGSSTTSTVVANNFEKNSLSAVSKGTPPSSDNDGDIIPSTTTTPDRKRNGLPWDLAGDLTSGQIDHQMDEVSLNSYRNPSSSQKLATKKATYNSDGDDTHTSGSSDKVDDHAAADQALAEMSAILRPHPQLMMTAAESGTTRGISSAQDVDEMLSNFRNQRRELESRYQQLSNPGLADKVFRILTSQDPEAQADGILSQVSAQEREERARYALNLHSNKDFNFSTSDTDNLNTSNQSFPLPDDVRRRLDLSGLSSADGSKLADKSSLVLPSSKGFSAFDDMTKYLSSQVAKVSERTFNHSLEMHIPPQSITCYPLFADHKENDLENGDKQNVIGTSAAAEEQSVDLFSGHPQEGEPTATSSPIEAFTDEGKEERNTHHSSPEDSDSSSGKKKEKYRPYRPPGSKDFYYTESDAASIADSITTVESTHIGSDDAKGPILPSSALGSRKDPPSSGGIYAKHKALSSVPEGESLPPIQEKSVSDDRDSEINPSIKSIGSMNSKEVRGMTISMKQRENTTENRESRAANLATSAVDDDDCMRPSHSASGSSTGGFYSRGVAAARRDAQWENRIKERGQDSMGHQSVPNIDETVAKFTELSDLGNIRSIGTFPQRSNEDEGAAQRQVHNNNYSDQGLTKDIGMDEPLSLRVKMTYTDHPENKQVIEPEKGGRRLTRESIERERHDFRTESRNTERAREKYKEKQESDVSAYRTELSRPSPSSYFDNEEDFSRTVQNTVYRRRSWDQDYSSSPVRDARLSPAFHQALSSEFRQAIEARSPLLSQNIERSLAQAPTEMSARYAQNNTKEESFPQRSSSPPPTFLARERGQPPREYARTAVGSSRRSPPPSTTSGRQAWTDRETRSPTQVRNRDLTTAPIPNTRPRPFSTDDLQTQPVPPSPISRDHHTRSLSPNARTQGYRSASPTSEQRTKQTNPVTFLHPNQRSSTRSTPEQQNKQPSSPVRLVERTLENMTSESENTDIDREPLSRRAQMLTAALPQERDISPDVNTLWERFKALNESNDSSMDSSRIEAITDLLRNPSQHLIAQYLKEREEYRIERQERAEADRVRRLREQQANRGFGMTQLHSSSEDDFKEGFNEVRAKKEEERIKRRAAKKKKFKPADTGKVRHDLEEEKNKENVPDSLFSIPENTGSDHSPAKGSASQKSLKSKLQPKQHQEDHIIDPYMQKLRDKISKQRGKIDKQTLKEFQRMEKLKKLEHLLSAKKRGQISDQTLDAQLGEMSSTSTPGSNSSGENENVNSNSHITPLSEDSTTAKDSSAEMHAWKAEKERRLKETKLLEMERRKEFRSRQTVETMEMDRHVNTKLVKHHSKGKAQNSELKLLKLVNEGYLTPDEAYRLAMERAQQNEMDEERSICSYSSSEDFSFTNRPHHFYSPYARQDEFGEIKSKPKPKLKQLSPTTFADVGSALSLTPQTKYQRKWDRRKKNMSEDEIARVLPRPSRFTSPKHWQSQSDKGYLRTSSRSPTFHQAKSTGSFKSHSSLRQNNDRYGSSLKRSGSSPPRKYLYHHHHHQHPQHEKGRNSTKQDVERPVSAKGVSWHIPIDMHPSKWEEPQVDQCEDNMLQKDPRQNCKAQQNKNSNKKREQLPLPELSLRATNNHSEEPLQHWEKQAFTSNEGFWHKSDHPQGIPQELWQEVISQDALASKANHYEVDPLMDRVQYILNRESPADVKEDQGLGMTLQEAFLTRKQIFISKCRERQKRIALARENRHLQECLRLEREAIFADQGRVPTPNLHAHPCSENLYHPKQRIFTKSEMKALTEKRYKKLHEVIQKQEKEKAEAESKLNRLRVRMFNKKVQRGVLKKTSIRQR